ncbi:MAG: glycosyltransferase [Caulobacterales bacterium]|nr:glycosyltransferase [Caulobacterales bacterium]
MKPAVALATIAMDRMAGGLERNVAYLANDLAEAGHRVVLVTFDPPGAQAFYDLHPAVVWRRMDGRPHTAIGFRDRLRLIQRMRRVLIEDGVGQIVCFHHGILARFLMARAGLNVRLVCSERNALSLYRYASTRKWNLNFLLMAFVDRITVQFARYAQDYPAWLRRKISVVHNPVWPVAPSTGEREAVILSVGRHSTQKRFDLLIQAFVRIAADRPEWRLKIIGDGPLMAANAAAAQASGVGDRIELLPAMSGVQGVMAASEIYCQPSQWEGFPNALAEAMANGAVPVGFRETAGVSDLIRDGVDGRLVDGPPDPAALAHGLAEVMDAPDLRRRLSEAARQLPERYSAASWRQAWREVLAL